MPTPTMKPGFTHVAAHLVILCHCYFLCTELPSLSVATASVSPTRPSDIFLSIPRGRRQTLTSFVSRTKSHRCRRQTKHIPFAAIIINSEGNCNEMANGNSASGYMGGGATSTARALPSLPNWRDMNINDNGDKSINGDSHIIHTPFCHHLTREETPNKSSSDSNIFTPITTAAPWSKSAYQSALDLYDRLIAICNNSNSTIANTTTMDYPYNNKNSIASVVKLALHDLEMAYRLYGPYCMIGSYNGGKDAVVIFHLMRAVHAHHCRNMMEDNNNNSHMIIPRPRVVYFQHRDEFPEVLSLLRDTVERYDVDMLAFSEGVSFMEGLRYLVERNFIPGMDGYSFRNNVRSYRSAPHPLAFVLGTRKNDPNAGSQGVYAPSSTYMPPFLRCNPILDWTYGDVWEFLRTFDLPYCILYDRGYTSLGNVGDTFPCPALLKTMRNMPMEMKGADNIGDDDDEYWPAYMLRDWDLERAGRIDKKSTASTTMASNATNDPTASENATLVVTLSKESSTEEKGIDENKQLTESMSAILNKADDTVLDLGIDGHPLHHHQRTPQSTVGLIVIGDEILKGMTPDSNIVCAAKALRAKNIAMSRVSIISDDMDDIVEEIRRFEKDVDYIITSGGVGPTHDDVTIKSVAEALCLDLEIHYEMV